MKRNNIECREMEAEALLRRVNLRDGKEIKYRDWKSFFNRDYAYQSKSTVGERINIQITKV